MQRNTHLALRSLAVIVVELTMLFGIVVLSVTQGCLVYYVLSLSHVAHRGAAIFGLLAGLVAFAGGWAGRDHFLARMRAWLDPGPEDEGTQ